MLLIEAATARFGETNLDGVCRRLLDLEEQALIKFLNPMARLTGWSAPQRIDKGSDFRLTIAGADRVDDRRTVQAGPNFYIYGDVGQVAGRDITNHFTITQEIVQLALEELDRRQDVAETTRQETRGMIERAKGHTTEILIAAAGTDAGALALELIKHGARAIGVPL